MNTLRTLAALSLLTAAACAPMQAATTSDSVDPARIIRDADDGWIAISMPVIEGTRSPCCWKGNWPGAHTVGCSLDKEFSSYGTMSKSPLTDALVAYTEVKNGQVHRLKIVGEHCPMDTTGHEVALVASADDRAVLNWLDDLATDAREDRIGHSAIWALALHASPSAGDRLYRLARDGNHERAEEAVFWLGEARGQAGYELLKDLLDELPAGEARQRINFALSQNPSKEAVQLLEDIARNDRDSEQRADALFWLAEEHPEAATGLILEVIDTETDHEVLDRAVFAMSQLPDGVAGPMLLELARNESAPREARRQALFWLANSGDEDSVIELTELLTR